MKSRTWILILVVVLFVLFWMLWPRSSPLGRIVEQQTEAPATVMPATVSQVPQSVSANNPSLGEILKHTIREKTKEAQEDFNRRVQARNVPIDFYGQTVDQNSNPLAGVQIKLMVAHYLPGLEGMSIPVNRTSDANGFFDVHDASVTGDGFDMAYVSKDGYTLEPMARSFGPVGGAPGNPMLLKLWRNDIKEPLVTGRDALDIIADGRSYVINVTNNFITGGIQGSGDFSVWIKRPDGVTWSNRFDWSCELHVIGGGLAEEPDLKSAMYVAPTDAYTNGFHFDATNGWGKTTGARRFYLRLGNGNYGRASIEILSYFDHQAPGLIRIEYAINPTGSRILR